jgi:hypothetical protein
MPDNWLMWAGGLAVVFYLWRSGWLSKAVEKLPVAPPASDPVAAALKVLAEEAVKQDAKEKEAKVREAVRSVLK